MNLQDRTTAFDIMFDELQNTSYRSVKERIVQDFNRNYPELQEDLVYILETLDGRHPIGWTFVPRQEAPLSINFNTIKDMIRMCESTTDKSYSSTRACEMAIGDFGEFLAPIVNRTLRLGIGKSLLVKENYTPMLAKKYEGGLLRGDYAITEKLDGNRCEAVYDHTNERWNFFSRSGKPLKVNFDMTGMNTDLIYDGEIMSDAQTDLSIRRNESLFTDIDLSVDTKEAQLLFNKTSGLINRQGEKKGLVYNMFDIIDNNMSYANRQLLLRECEPKSRDLRILPILYVGNDVEKIDAILGRITQTGGEGVMLNAITRNYEQKRTDALLKYKIVKSIDMVVVGVYEGTGKYTNMIGGLSCKLVTTDGKIIICDVGSGLSDYQRMIWMQHPELIMNKIVQVGYHEMTQNEENVGTNLYSLRFPRFVKIRSEKDDTSEF